MIKIFAKREGFGEEQLKILTSEKGLSQQQIDLINDGYELLVFVREQIEKQGNLIDMTCRIQLRDDSKAVERIFEKMLADKWNQDEEELKNRVLRLQTSAEHILG